MYRSNYSRVTVDLVRFGDVRCGLCAYGEAKYFLHDAISSQTKADSVKPRHFSRLKAG